MATAEQIEALKKAKGFKVPFHQWNGRQKAPRIISTNRRRWAIEDAHTQAIIINAAFDRGTKA